MEEEKNLKCSKCGEYYIDCDCNIEEKNKSKWNDFEECDEKEKVLKNPVFDEETKQFVEKKDYDEKQNWIYIHQLAIGQKWNCTDLKIDDENNSYELINRFYYCQPFFYENKIFWKWDTKNFKWTICDEIDLLNLFDDTLMLNNEVIYKKRLYDLYIRELKSYGKGKIPKKVTPKWIQFRDKVYSLSSKRIWTPTSDYFFTNSINWDIGESEETPIIDKMFTEWVGEANKQVLYELMAYCLYGAYPIHKIFCLVGCGANGKSTFLGLLRRFIGIENCGCADLDFLMSNKFEAFSLYKKLVCEMSETNFGTIGRTSRLKSLSGGQDLIKFEMKGKEPYSEVNYAKIIIATNSLPISDDTTDGFYRRWLIIDFPNQFEGGGDILSDIPDVEFNNLAKKCLNILPILLKRKNFTNEVSFEERREKYILSSNPLPIFLKEYCIKDETAYILYGELYSHYIRYLRKIKKRRIKHPEFKKCLEDEGFFVDSTSKKILNKKTGFEEWYHSRWINGLSFRGTLDDLDLLSTYIKDKNIELNIKRSIFRPNVHQTETIKDSDIDNTILDNQMSILKWSDKELVWVKCNIENCNNSPCNYDRRGIPYCKRHFDEIGI